MKYINLCFAAAVLFGLVHPGSKIIMGQGIDLMSFCILYVMIRLLAQLPIVVRRRSYQVPDTRIWVWLIAIGVVGAGLQFNEFRGIANGLSVPTVTFIVYSHPIWSLIFSRVINKEPITWGSFLQLLLGLLGVICIFGNEISFASQNLRLMLSPLFAGVLIALWVSISNRAKRLGASTWTISFYYDLFAVISLFAMRLAHPESSMSSADLWHWIAVPGHMLVMSAYSIFVGLLPNILFYQGSASTTARAAGLVLLMEPLVATFVSHWIWLDRLSMGFFVGGFCILCAGIPLHSFRLPPYRKTSLIGIFLLFFLMPNLGRAGDAPAVHGMLVFGDQEIYFSHLPMFHPPHDFQVILKMDLGEVGNKLFLADQQQHPESFYTFVPEPVVLSDFVSGKKALKGDLYRGHFERGGRVIQKTISAQVISVIYFHKFVPSEVRPSRLTYLLFGEREQIWGAHLISEKPDFDHIVKMAAPSLTLKPDHALPVTFPGVTNSKELADDHVYSANVGDAPAQLSVGKTKYIEFDDLSM